ncbi:ISLre2 family transposase, partial [Microcystis aeruginosa CS-567/02-A1]|nr:ISLre2 family transposase [Microcystis aeruginosa CS-567/02-A1]
MKNSIYSSFDLNKSLGQFQEKVTKLLELTNISEWDGRVFKEREETIRESALVLAGECTALLLHKLSKSQEFLDKAMQETQGWWHEKTQKHGCKKRQILTIGNVEVSLKLPYVVERQTQPKKNQKILNEGFCPFLRYLGM